MGPGDEEQNGRRGLNGARILVVEDEYYLAEDLADALRSGGAVVVGPVGSLGQAEEPLAAGRLDGAVLDMNLRGEPGFALAERLQADGVPFVIVSGYSSEAIPHSLSQVPRLEKPIDSRDAVKALAQLLAERTR
jgi:DNA-binding NtrC family response regulator